MRKLMKQRRPKNTLKSMAVMGIMVVTSAPSATAWGPSRSVTQTYIAPPADYNGGQSTKEFMAQLEELKLLANVERRFSEAEAKVAELAERAIQQEIAAPGSLDCPLIVVEASLAHANILEALGRKLEALATLKAVVSGNLPALAAPKKEPEVKAAKTLKTAITAHASAHVNLAKRVAELSTETAQDAGPVLDDLVKQLADQGNWNSIEQLGNHAVAPLRKYLQAKQLDQFIQPAEADFLILLARLDEVAAAHFIIENLEAGGALWRQRIVNAIDFTNALRSSNAWDSSAGYPSNPLRVHWLRVLERLAAYDDVSGEAIRLMYPVAYHGALTPSLQQAMIRALQNGATKQVQAVLETLELGYRNPSAKPVLEAALASPSDHVRVFAAQKLVAFEDCSALLDHADDSSAAVRQAVAQALSGRKTEFILRVRQIESVNSGYADVTPRIGERERALIAKLVGDDDPDVRRIAYEALTELDHPLDGSVYLELTSDPDEQVRKSVAAHAGIHAPELRVQVLARFAPETSRAVLKEVDQALFDAEWTTHTKEFLPIFRSRWSHATSGIKKLSGPNTATRLLEIVRQTPLGLNQLTDWAIQDRDTFVLWNVVTDRSSLARLSAAQIKAVYPMLVASNPENAGDKTAEWIREKPEGRALRQPMFELSADTTLPIKARILAAGCMAQPGGPQMVERFSQLLLDPSLTAENVVAGRHDIINTTMRIINDMSAQDVNQVIFKIVSNPSSVDLLAAYVCNRFEADTDVAGKLADAIIVRWFDSTQQAAQAAVTRAIMFMGKHTEHADAAVLVRAIEVDHYAMKAIETVGKVRAPEFLPALEEILRTRPGTNEWLEASFAVEQYMNDEAAELLLKAAGWAADGGGRKSCLDGLESIRTFQDAQERWAQRRVKTKEREDVVAELVTMLDDPDIVIRVEAIRSLASFKAVEQMPRLIRLLKHEHQAIRDAARNALDILHVAQLADKK